MHARTGWTAALVVAGLLVLPGVTEAKGPDRKGVVKALVSSQQGKELEEILGKKTLEAVIDLIIDHNLKNNWKTMTTEAATNAAQGFLEIELKNCKAVMQVLDDLEKGYKSRKLDDLIDKYPMKPKDFGAEESDSEFVKASKWINHASTTTRGKAGEIEAVAKILEEAAKKTELDSLQHLQTLNKVLVNKKKADPYRPIVLGSPLPSSVAGERLLELALQRIKGKPPEPNLACYLLGAIVRCHGFVDGNGRTARAAYALALLKARGGKFEAISVKGENELHHLDDSKA
ncbi:MAG: hypothetical protein KatS3mg102_0502 [Planctomycetota bacterium]|nr:MAG: hypothetical protein KatS3mg102_0502 [Planctomycetota bacterium]